MPLRQLLYTSQATARFDRLALDSLLESARRWNQAHDITGLLLGAANGNFVQLIEGPADEVEKTFARIKADRNHTAVSILLDQPVGERAFPNWTMGYQDLDRFTQKDGIASVDTLSRSAAQDNPETLQPVLMMVSIHDANARTNIKKTLH